MADLAATDVTVAVQNTLSAPTGVLRSTHKQKRNIVKVTFGNGTLTYPAGGVPIPAFGKFGMEKVIDYLTPIDSDDANGLVWKFDFANQKLRAYRSVSRSLVIEEVVEVTTNVGQLRQLPAHIFMVHVTDGTTTGAMSVIPTGKTPLTKMVAVTMTDGKLTFLSTDAVTRVKVSYIPLSALGDPTDLVVDESVTIDSSDEGVLAANACAVQNVWNADGTANMRAIREKDLANTAVTNGQVSIDFTPASGNTELTLDNDTTHTTALVTYLKSTAFTLIEEEAISLAAELGSAKYPGVPATGQWINSVGGTAGPNIIVHQEIAAASVGAGAAQWAFNWSKNVAPCSIGFDAATPVTSDKVSYILMPIFSGLGPAALEELLAANAGSAPAAQTLYMEAVGW